MRTFMKVWVGIALLAVGFGLIVIILAMATKPAYQEKETVSLKESYGNVENIDIDVNYGEVTIINGDTFSIDASNIRKDELKSYVEDGTWYIKGETKNYITVFGVRISLGDLLVSNNNTLRKITITMPENFTAGQFSLKIGAGYVEADAIKADSGKISVDAGKLSVNQLSISDSSQYNVGAGEMVLRNVTANNISLDCGVGNIVIEGSLSGDNDISCGVGQVELNLTNQEQEFSYDISSGIGSVDIGNQSFHNVDKRIDNGSNNYLNLDCGIGHISVDFNQK